MLITVSCPRCGTKYNLKRELIGQRIRCPSAGCREVFEVRESSEAAAPPPTTAEPTKPGQASGPVQEMVPLLSAEAAKPARTPATVRGGKSAPPPPAAPAEVAASAEASQSASWQLQPPPVRKGGAPAETDAPDNVFNFGSSSWNAPPVRRAAVEPEAPSPPAETSLPPSSDDSAVPPARSRRWLVGALVLLVAGIAGGSVVYLVRASIQSEEERYQAARREYSEGRFARAEKQFRLLETDYPDSDRAGEYKFLADLSGLRNLAYDLQTDREKSLADLQEFHKERGKHALMKQYAADVWETQRKLTAELLAAAKQNLQPPANLERARQQRELAEQSLDQLRGYTPREADASELDKLAGLAREVAQGITRLENRQKVLAELGKLAQKPATPESIERGEALARDSALLDEPDVKKLLDGMQSKWIESIRYFPDTGPIKPLTEDREPSLLVAPRLDATGESVAGNGVVFALARGVLHALAEKDGAVLWAVRSGVDTTTLPIRLPGNPEIALVLSSDSNTISARETTTGSVAWRQTLSAPCLGRPVVAGQRLFVPTADGKVHELELPGGKRQGWYELGVPLTSGGVHQPGTNLLYFPADRRFVFVLDAAQKRCLNVLQTGHGAASLRGEPIIAGAGTATSGAGYLILCQADGLGSMKLRAFGLPVQSSQAGPLQPDLRLRGWSWFPALCDGEKLTLITDAGTVGLFGVNQPHNRDRPLFPLLSSDFTLGHESLPPERALVVHAEEFDFWVLAQGELHLLRLGWDRQRGPRLGRQWTQPVRLGTPLHAGQVNERRDTLFLVTKTEPATCLASAVDANTGVIRWQRQLGLLCQGEPLRLGDTVAVRDQGQGVFLFDPSRQKVDADWQPGGQMAAPPLETDVVTRRYGETALRLAWLLPASDGKTLLDVTCIGGGRTLAVRRCEPGKSAARRDIPLLSPLAGTPGFGPACLVLPLADGTLLRQLYSGAKAESGHHWRAEHADSDSLAHVLHLGGDDYLATDGSRGLTLLSWPAGKLEKPKRRATLPARIVSIPAVIPDPKAPLVAVADIDGTVTLLKLSDLSPVRSWPLDGKITAGPFVRGGRIGCVVDRRYLVWIDPARDLPIWRHAAADAIVGQPHLIGHTLVVADMAGKLVGLDPAGGQPRGPGCTFKANVAPAAAPVPFGKDRLFAPLTDGTIVLPELRLLQ